MLNINSRNNEMLKQTFRSPALKSKSKYEISKIAKSRHPEILAEDFRNCTGNYD